MSEQETTEARNDVGTVAVGQEKVTFIQNNGPQNKITHYKPKDNEIFHCPDIKRPSLVAAGANTTVECTEDGLMICKMLCQTLRGHVTKRLTCIFHVKSVACGQDHIVCASKGGEVFACGGNSYGQLGTGNNISQRVLVPVDQTNIGDGVHFVMVACGECATIGLSKDGTIFTWGHGAWGGLGHDNQHNKLVPTEIPPDRFKDGKLRQVVAGGYHMVAVADNGDIWAWGHNGYGQLGLGDTNDRWFPQRLQSTLDSSRVRMVACGSCHTVAVTTKGEVWAWGSEQYVDLGLNTGTGKTLVPKCVNPSNFGDQRVWSVHSGGEKWAAVTMACELVVFNTSTIDQLPSHVQVWISHKARYYEMLVLYLYSDTILPKEIVDMVIQFLYSGADDTDVESRK